MRPFEPADLPAMYDVYVRSHQGFSGPLLSEKMLGLMVGDPPSTDVREAWVTPDLSGWYSLRAPMAENLHFSSIGPLAVDPARQREGIGRALFEHAIGRARALGRTTVVWETPAGLPGEKFSAVMGGTPALPETRSVLDLAGADWESLAGLEREAAGHASGYTVAHLPWPAPEDLLPALVTLMEGMDDIPTGEIDFAATRWTPARYQEFQQRLHAKGVTSYITTATHTATGEPAAFTVVVVDEDHGGWAKQQDTAVLRAHRGKRLGLLVKLANARWMHETDPSLDKVLTWNADSNEHMLAINHAMGFRPLDQWATWQVVLTDR
ncbi:GNAT family N-acetyltransferase [Nonomuraea sp. NPDC050663]|uniref:GNAT family N-acetyltransferase n=1 Tax=Nonomuraea sp. NPDC050663 TaxID=3364370 RepID=UPI0037A28B44